MGNIENVITNFCKKTKTVGVPWVQTVGSFLQMYPTVDREAFELCMFRQRKKAALTLMDYCINHREQGFDALHQMFGITKGFWEVCIGEDQIRDKQASLPSYDLNSSPVQDVAVLEKKAEDDTGKPESKSLEIIRKIRKTPTKIYMTIFQAPANEYSKESWDILKRFVESLERPIEIIECTNSSMIEIRVVQ
jgi:hypothetical protein